MSASVQILDRRIVYGDGHHNAWTDLALFQDRWYVAFHSGWWHHYPGHRAVYVHSTDLSGTEWSPPRGFYPLDAAGLLRGENARFFVWRGCLWNIPHLREPTIGAPWSGTEKVIRPYVSYSPDGVCWADYVPIEGVAPDRFFWTVRAQGDVLYATAFELSYSTLPLDRRRTWLLRSDDGVQWEPVSRWLGHQSAMAFAEDGLMYTTASSAEPEEVKRTGTMRPQADRLQWARPPYTEWEAVLIGGEIHSPALWAMGDRVVMAGVECLDDSIGRQTTIRVYDGDRVSPPKVLYPRGDCGYPGLRAIPGTDDELLVSYYGGEQDRLSRSQRKRGCSLVETVAHAGVTFRGWHRNMDLFLQPSDIHVAHIRVV